MTLLHTARAAEPRALVGAAALGSMLGLAIGGAYLAGGLARAAIAHAHIHALAAQVDGSLSESALNAAAGDAGTLAIARRIDGTAPNAQDLADRRMARLALQTLQAPAPAPVVTAPSVASQTLQPETLFHVATSTAQPFHLRGALDASRDLECLTQAVYYEARGESQEGQRAIAQVVLNRVRHPAFPKSICGVVFQHAGSGCQFSFACDGSISHHMESGAWRRAQSVAAAALDGKVEAAVGTATHFHVAALGDIWQSGMMKVAQIGSHVFYRFGGAAGAPKMFHAEAQPSTPAPEKLTAPRILATSFGPLTADLAGGRLISASTAVVERAAAAVEGVAKVAKPEPVKAETPRAADTASTTVPATAG